MLKKGTKRLYMFIAIISMLLAITALVPFRTFFEAGHTVDLIVKLIVLPIIIIGISVCANIKKYKEIDARRTRSKVVNVMSYFPTVIYLIAILLATFQVLTIGDENYSAYVPLGIMAWGLIAAFIVAIVVALIVFQSCLVNKIVMSFDRRKTLIFDFSLAGLLLVSLVASFILSQSYYQRFHNLEFYNRGNLWLLITLIVAVVLFFILIGKFNKFINKDEVLIRVDVNELESGEMSPETMNAEYMNAYRKVKAQYNDKINKVQQDYKDAFDKVYTEYNMALEKFVLEHKSMSVSPEETVETPAEEK